MKQIIKTLITIIIIIAIPFSCGLCFNSDGNCYWDKTYTEYLDRRIGTNWRNRIDTSQRYFLYSIVKTVPQEAIITKIISQHVIEISLNSNCYLVSYNNRGNIWNSCGKADK